MDERGRNNFNNRQNAYFKYYFFYQIFIFQQRHHPVSERFGKIEPGNQSRRQEYQIGNFNPISQQLRLLRHNYLKYHIIHRHSDHRLHHGPYASHIGSRIPAFKIVLRQTPYQPPVLVKLKREEDYLIVKFQYGYYRRRN